MTDYRDNHKHRSNYRRLKIKIWYPNILTKIERTKKLNPILPPQLLALMCYKLDWL